MRWALAVLVLLAAGSAAWGDGCPVVGAAFWQKVSEGTQTAVVAIHPDRTATVDLFISLVAKPGARPRRCTSFCPSRPSRRTSVRGSKTTPSS